MIKRNNKTDVRFDTPDPEPRPAKPYRPVHPFPERKGTGHISSFPICDGLEIGISHCRFDKDHTARFALETPLLSLGFCLKGHSTFRNFSRQNPIAAVPGRSYADLLDSPVVERKIFGEQDILTLGILVSSGFLMKLFNPSRHQDTVVQNKMEKILKSRHFHADHAMTSQMKATVYQILNNPHQGEIGRIYLESKALELIALKLEQVVQPDCLPPKDALMEPGDRDRIFQARDLLVKKLQHPSSLRKLARQVGMSHTRLTRGFRMVFGCTVFEYLRKERLSYARMLIEENPVDLTWIAYESGFCSSSHFAASFFKAYGIRPSEYRKSVSTIGLK